MKSSNLYFGGGVALLFVILGIYLINRSSENTEQVQLYLIVGIACLVFFGGVFLASILKLIKQQRSK